MALLICGHPRSGTTLLRNLCHLHPQMAVTHEFGAFYHLGEPFRDYRRYILERWRSRNVLHYNLFPSRRDRTRWRRALRTIKGHVFTAAYLFHLQRHRGRPIDSQTVESIYRSIFPGAIVIGDKMPDAVFHIGHYIEDSNISLAVIYRDVRDVVSSVLEMSRKLDGHRSWKGMNSAARVAGRWIESIEVMEKHREHLHIIRYESLITEPEKELLSLGEYLGVDGRLFRRRLIKDNRIGKYRSGLSRSELDEVMKIAGSTLSRLGYR